MSGGGDSAGIGTSLRGNRVLGPSNGRLVGKAKETATGAGMLNGVGAGAHVEQQTDPWEHPPWDS